MKTPPIHTTSDNISFRSRNTPFRQIFEVPEYRFSDIGPGDYVLDIGANVGAFCIRAARISTHITAVEPVTVRLLEENLRLNNVNVTVIPGALGDGRPSQITWDGCRVSSPTYTLRSLIEVAGGCDFLKCDCEGAEWLIDPADLETVRRIEMEVHIPPISGPPDPALLEYISRHYDFSIDRVPCHDVLGIMGILHAERRN